MAKPLGTVAMTKTLGTVAMAKPLGTEAVIATVVFLPAIVHVGFADVLHQSPL